MPKDEWGVKRVCPSCEGRFYDLQKEDMVCPYCSAEFSLASLLSDKPTIDKAAEKEKAEKADDVDDADVVLDDDDDDADIDTDDTLLDDDDDDTVPLEEIADVAAESDDDS
jgi:uncharacterized protein (TIGR02300 family)